MTLKEVQALNDEELRIKVAQLCDLDDPRILHKEHEGDRGVMVPYKEFVYGKHGLSIPNYPQDLNAMHEVEVKNIIPHVERRGFYRDTLSLLVDGGYTGGRMIYAKVRQRAEAFVLTMEGA